MSTRLERTIEALSQRLANEHDVDLTMKINGDRVNVEPYINGMYEVYFAKYGVVETAKSIEEVAQWLIDYPAKPEERIAEEKAYEKENIPKLQKFYEENIKGHTPEELNLGNDICLNAYKLYDKLVIEKPNYVFDKSLDNYYLTEYQKEHNQYSLNELKNAYDFANNFEYYSDWHKDIYGFRPRTL